MKFLIVASCLLALAAATPGYLGAGPVAYSAASPFAYGAAPVAYAAAPAHVAYAAAPVAYSAAAVAPASVSTQHHAQDTLGQYNYGYSDSNSAKQEVRTADGITRGGYSYVDGNGIVQSTSYVSDALGFRVAATNLPVGPAPVVAAAPAVVGAAIVGPAETPEVIAARAAHFNAHAVAKANLLGRKKRSPGYLGAAIAAPAVATYAAPAIAYAAPAVVPVHNFGYSSASVHPAQVVPASPNVVAPAVAAYAAPAINAYAAHGVVAAHGIVAAPGVVGAAIVGPAETPEVVAARAAHFEAHAIAKANLLGRKKRSPGYLGAAYATPAVAAYAAPAVATYAAPAIAYAAPAVVPVHNFGYSSASVHPAQVVAAAPAVAAYAAPAVYANAYTAHAIAKSHLLG